jgi:glycosyltransferase involved in cell wall biosynthesis
MMNNSDLVSVIIPIYGVELYLNQCIESIIKQSYDYLQIILVNDGSKDNCKSICEYYSSIDNRIEVINKKNGGLVNARKSGLEIAKGRYVTFVDGDDWVGENFILNLVTPAVQFNSDLIVSGHIREFYGQETFIKPKLNQGYFTNEILKKSILPISIYNGSFFQHGISTYVWNKLFKKEKLKHFLSIIDENIVMGEDAALTYPYLFSCNDIYITHDCDYYYRQRPNSIVKSVPNLVLEYSQLSLLFKHLKSQLLNVDFFDIQSQLKLYFISQVLIRSGGIINSDIKTMPFSNIQNAINIVVFSSGSFGQHLISSLQKLNLFNIVSWIDEDHVESQIFGLEVNSIETIVNLNFDLVLIASIDTKYNIDAKSKLLDLGILDEKISCFDLNFEVLENAIFELGFELDSFNYKNQIYGLQ